MSRERKVLSGPEKLGILKRYLVEKVPISDLCDQHGLQPSQVYYWQAQLFEHGASVCDRVEGSDMMYLSLHPVAYAHGNPPFVRWALSPWRQSTPLASGDPRSAIDCGSRRRALRDAT